MAAPPAGAGSQGPATFQARAGLSGLLARLVLPSRQQHSSTAQAQAQAQADLKALQQQNRSITPRDVQGLISAHADEPQYIGHLMAELYADGGAFDSAVIYAFSPTVSHEVQQVIVSAVELAVDQGLLSNAAIQSRVARYNIAEAQDFIRARQDLRASGANPAQIIQDLTNSTPALRNQAVLSLSSVSQGAEQLLTDLNQQLSEEMARFGPAMTAEQRQQFIEAFKARHPEYQAAREAQQELGQYISAHAPQLKADALANPEMATTLYSAMTQLAGTAQNEQVVELLMDSELTRALNAAALRRGENFVETVVAPATGAMIATVAMESGSDRAALGGMAERLDRLNAELTRGGLRDALDVASTGLRELATALRAYANGGSAEALSNKLTQINQNVYSATPLGKMLAGANFLIGSVLIADGVLSGDPAQLMAGLLQTSQSVHGPAYALELASQYFPNLVSAEDAANAVKVGQRAAYVLGALVNGMLFVDQAGQMESGSDRLKAAGYFSSAAGNLMMLLPGGQIPGAIFIMLGIGMGLAGGALDNMEQDAARKQEMKELLAGLRPPLNPLVVSALGSLPQQSISGLQEGLSLTPEQWQRLIIQDGTMLADVGSLVPGLLEQLHQGFGVSSLADLERVYAQLQPPGTSPQYRTELLRELAGQDLSKEQSVRETLGLSPAGWRQLAVTQPALAAELLRHDTFQAQQLASVFGVHDLSSLQQFFQAVAPQGMNPENLNTLLDAMNNMPADREGFREAFEQYQHTLSPPGDEYAAVWNGVPPEQRPPAPDGSYESMMQQITLLLNP